MGDLVTYGLDGGVATLTMDDGKVNVFSVLMLEALHAALDRAESDEAVVLLTGRDGYFSAGFDLKVIAGGTDQLAVMLRLGATLAERVMAFPRPVVVACTGHAYPAGAFLLLAADVRIGTAGSYRIGLNEVRIGLSLPRFAVEIARYRLQPSAFSGLLVTGTMCNPDEAVTAGYLDRVVAEGELAGVASEAAHDMTNLDAKAHLATKLRVREPALHALRLAIESELEPSTSEHEFG